MLDAFHTEQLGEGIFGQLHAADAPKVALDLHNAEFLSSSALGVRRCAAQNRHLVKQLGMGSGIAMTTSLRTTS